MFSCQIVVGVVAVTLPTSTVSGQVLIACSSLFVAGFASTWGPVSGIDSSLFGHVRFHS